MDIIFFNKALWRSAGFVTGTSKGAVDQLTRMMALELGPHQVNDFFKSEIKCPLKNLRKRTPVKLSFLHVINNLSQDHILRVDIENPFLASLNCNIKVTDFVSDLMRSFT